MDPSLRGWEVAGRIVGSWGVHVLKSRLNQGFFFVGVCDAEGSECWGLQPQSGLLYRLHADSETGQISLGPPPTGYPDACRTQVMLDIKTGNPTNLVGRVEGSTIEVIIDDDNRLNFRINGGRLLPSEAQFPPDAPLRKWIFVVDPDDTIVMAQRSAAGI